MNLEVSKRRINFWNTSTFLILRWCKHIKTPGERLIRHYFQMFICNLPGMYLSFEELLHHLESNFNHWRMKWENFNPGLSAHFNTALTVVLILIPLWYIWQKQLGQVGSINCFKLNDYFFCFSNHVFLYFMGILWIFHYLG